MPRPNAKIVPLFPPQAARPAMPAWQRREMDRDIQSLQELANQLQQLKAPLREASNGFIKMSTPEARPEVELKLGALNTLVVALGSSMKALGEAMAMHQGPAADGTPIH